MANETAKTMLEYEPETMADLQNVHRDMLLAISNALFVPEREPPKVFDGFLGAYESVTVSGHPPEAFPVQVTVEPRGNPAAPNPAMVGPLLMFYDPTDYSDLKPADWIYGVRLAPHVFEVEIRSVQELQAVLSAATTENIKLRHERDAMADELAALKPKPEPQPTDNAFARRHDGRAPDRREP